MTVKLPSPAVGVIVPTHNRPKLVRRAIESIVAQEYSGRIEIIVVYDRSEPDTSLATNDPDRRVVVTTNERTPGLAGARNTGVLASDTELVAFCDDDDTWLPGKLEAQHSRLKSHPGAQFVTTAMRVDYAGETSAVRRANQSQVTVHDLARSRFAMLHSSSFLFRRSAMLGPDGFGLVDETITQSMGEDWDLLLRAARKAPIEHVDEPLVAVLWGSTSYFNNVWVDKNAAHQWLIAHHPEFREDKYALGHMLGKLAFGHAALGQRRTALRFAASALRTRWQEPRTPFALLAVAGVPPNAILKVLNRHGHGI